MAPGKAGSRLALAIVLPLVVALGLIGAPACKKDGGKSSSSEKKAAKQKKPQIRDGISEDWRLEHPECLEARKIESKKAGTPEAAIWMVYEAALGDDNEANFQKFFAQLDPDKYKEKWARDQFWARLRKHVDKYTAGPDDPTFIVCREDKKSDERTKLFVFSEDPKKSHTPYGMQKKSDGAWKIDFFTP